MASKDITERRLRPIYDLIDHMNNKKAIQELDKLLKKQPNFQTAKVLKALAYIRMEKYEEADHLISNVMDEETIEDIALQPLTMCFRETNKLDMICKVYEKIIKKEPTNEEYLTHLFMAYLRIADYKNQQRVAMILYKSKPKNPYYFWAVMSIVMQAITGDPELARGVTWPLAERMIKKAAADGKIETESEVLLYLFILEIQGKYSDLKDVLNSPIAEKLIHTSCAQQKAEICLNLAAKDSTSCTEAVNTFKDLIHLFPDRFDYYHGLFSAVQISREGGYSSSDTDESLIKFINSIKSEEKIRGPALSKLLLGKILGYKGEELFYSFVHYVKNFGDKPCAFSDLRPFIGLLSSDQQHSMLDEIKTLANVEDYPKSVSQVFRHLLYLELERYFGRNSLMSIEEKKKRVQELCNYYEKTQDISGKSAQREIKPNDTYLVLAAHLLYDCWLESSHNEEYLLQGISLLHYGLDVSPANHHFKLLLVKYYTLLGGGYGAQQTYETLDIKYIQLDSLSHILVHKLLPLGQVKSAAAIYAQTLRFFSASVRESPEHLISCYKFGNYAKIPEMVNFQRRLEESLQFAMATTENMLLSLAFLAHSHNQVLDTAREIGADPDLDRYDNSDLIDNRDVVAFISYDNISDDEIKKNKTDTYHMERAYLLLRNTLLHTLLIALTQSADWSLSQQLSNGVANGVTHSKCEKLAKLRLELESKLEEIKIKEENRNTILPMPFTPKISALLASKEIEIVSAFAKCIESLVDFDSNSQLFVANVASICELIDGMKRFQFEESVIQYCLKQKIYFQVEVACLSTSLLNLIFTLLKSLKAKKSKKKRDEASQQLERSNTESYAMIRAKLHSWIESILNQLKQYEVFRLQAKTTDLAGLINIDGVQDITTRCRSKAWDGIVKNGVDEWKNVLNEKLKVLKTLLL
ncbi:N-alpha-acetyltransferase 25, NatB auxiliary subunit-like [Artemia franciscana]|uniref:N-terminal acetyltransferase B complex subunit MDM20 homolog n=1 Tax=Artemia franciscana TaxID=6661 RepID=A0AA88HW31_ARTSF|nr:hypothetical protein QYM36_009916 [Artemia franciscana]